MELLPVCPLARKGHLRYLVAYHPRRSSVPRIFDNIEQQLLPALRQTLVVSLRADARLCRVAEDVESTEPQVICSLGLRRKEP